MDTLTLKIIFMVGFVAAWAIRTPYQKQHQQTKHLVPQERILFMLIYVGMVVSPLIYVFSPLLSFADYRSPVWAGYVGGIVFAIALWLLWRSHDDLGKNWSPTVEIKEGHTLVSNGVYQQIRHPMYTAFWLWSAAQALILPNWIAGLGGILSFGMTYFLRIQQEEQMMIEQFGAEYKAYMQRTKRLIPYLF
ncbi:isoprenylcysteine carboxylmethyltransferase family protein [Pseudanabaenaceae cyanobacterium LEGE 13415]|nr:isoprenylcysteine carboxylmethyltransferase family protein [Pseudanabaenaceae cyanobacterium LEGE 13415]